MSDLPQVFSSSGGEFETSKSTGKSDRAGLNNNVYNGENSDRDYGDNEAPSPGADVETSASHCDVVWILFRVFAFSVDYGFDVWLIYDYFSSSEITYGFLTLSIITLSGIARTWMCYQMRHLDKRKEQKEPEQAEQNVIEKLPNYQRWILHVITLFKVSTWLHTRNCLCYALESRRRSQDYGPSKHLRWTLRFPCLFKAFTWLHRWNCQCDACKSKDCSRYYKMFLKEQEDASLLGIVASSTEATLQLILQLYIIWLDGLSLTTFPAWLKIIGSFTTLLVLGSSAMSFHINIRRAQSNKATVTRIGKVLIFCWQILMIVSRIFLILIVLRMSLYTLLAYMFIWIGWTGWIYYKKDGVLEFCLGRETAAAVTEPTNEEKVRIFFISAILGAVYVVMFVNLREEPTFWRYSVYYIVRAIEILGVAIAITFLFPIGCENLDVEHDWYVKPVFYTLVVSFIIEIACMGSYHQFFHPTANNRKSPISPKHSELKRYPCNIRATFKRKENRTIITQNGDVEPEKHGFINDKNNPN